MNEYKIYCGGEFITTDTKLPVMNKYTNELFEQTSLANKLVLDIAIKAAEEAKEACKNLSSSEKYEILKFISEHLFKDKKRLSQILCIESAKPLRYALAEIERAAQTFLIAAEESKRLPKEYISLDWTLGTKNKEGFIKYFPVGIVGGISPFNFPLNLAAHKIAPAIAAGCPIILKPASATPLSTLELAKIISQTNLPKGAVSILPMNRVTGNLLVTDDRINLLSFTGSPEIGWELKKQSGKKKVVLELGGNAGVIVTASADLEDALDKSLIGAFAYSGQICIHAQRFFIHKEIFEKFSKAFVQRTKKLNFGNPLNPETDVSDLIDEANAVRVESWVKEAVDQGAKLLCGGKRTGNYVEPTILTNCNINMKVFGEEVFGPVICLEEYDGTIENAVSKINDSKFGLQCGIFTDSVAELNYAFKNCSVGGVIHNDSPIVRYDQMPYGGNKESGLGREGVKYAILEMMEARVLVH